MIKYTDEQKEQMLYLLQEMMDKFKRDEELLGLDDERTRCSLDQMIGAKEIVEVMICEPVNLQRDGRVTVGF